MCYAKKTTTASQGLLNKVLLGFENPSSVIEEKPQDFLCYLGLLENDISSLTVGSVSVFQKYKTDNSLKRILVSLSSNSSDEERSEAIKKLRFYYPVILNSILCLYSSKEENESNGTLYCFFE